MTDIHLLIPDAALREAVLEQIKASGCGAPCVAENAQAAAKPGLAVIDEAAYDKKTATLFQGLAEKPVLLILGEGEDIEGVAETFPKPFRLGHLLTRIRYHIETAPLLRDKIIAFGGYRVEPQNRRLTHVTSPEPIRLTEKETALLVFLADCQQPATRRDILAAVWGYDERIDTHTLETHIYQLRRKLDDTGEDWLINEAGGYRLARGAEG